MSKYDLSGERFGMLLVVDKAYLRTSPNGKTDMLWHCKCDCGNEKDVLERSLIYAGTKSCGCLQRQHIQELRRRHGETGTRLYQAWENMRARCNRKSSREYENYGGRGIRVCDEWQNNYESFRDWALDNGYSDNLTLDRKNVNGNYCPENCRWISNQLQQYNKRTNRNISFNGKTQTITQWAKEYKIPVKTLQGRLDKSKWSIEKALTTPVTKNKSHIGR